MLNALVHLYIYNHFVALTLYLGVRLDDVLCAALVSALSLQMRGYTHFDLLYVVDLLLHC